MDTSIARLWMAFAVLAMFTVAGLPTPEAAPLPLSNNEDLDALASEPRVLHELPDPLGMQVNASASGEHGLIQLEFTTGWGPIANATWYAESETIQVAPKVYKLGSIEAYEVATDSLKVRLPEGTHSVRLFAEGDSANGHHALNRTVYFLRNGTAVEALLDTLPISPYAEVLEEAPAEMDLPVVGSEPMVSHTTTGRNRSQTPAHLYSMR